MILDIFKDSFEFAGQDIKVLLKLGLLSLFSFLILPEFLVMGYQYRVIDSGINGMIGGEDKLPEFDNFKGMFIDGFKLFIVQLIYVIVPLIVFFIFVSLAQYTDIDAFSAVAFILGVILFILAIFYSFLAIPNMIANEGSLKTAFDFKRINEIIKMIGVGRYIAFVIGLFLIVTVITVVVAVILVFLLGIFGMTAFALNPMAIGFIGIVWAIIYGAIFSFIISPYLSIFSGRANGLIYGLGA